MNHLTLPFKEPYRTNTIRLLAISVILLILSLIIGISDNLPGIIVCYSGMIVFVLTFTHHWRNAKPYLLLLISSLIGFLAFAVLHNVFYGIQKAAGDIFIITPLLEILHVVFFLLALFLFPPGVLVGLMGSIILIIKK